LKTITNWLKTKTNKAEDLPQVTAVTRSDSQRTTSSTKKKKPAGAKPKGKASEEDSRSVCSTGHRRADKPKVIFTLIQTIKQKKKK